MNRERLLDGARHAGSVAGTYASVPLVFAGAGMSKLTQRFGSGKVIAGAMLIFVTAVALRQPHAVAAPQAQAQAQARVLAPEAQAEIAVAQQQALDASALVTSDAPLVENDAPRQAALALGGLSVEGQLANGRPDVAVPNADWKEWIVREAAASDIPWQIGAALMTEESRWNPNATSYAGARGLAQFMPGTWAAVTGQFGWTAKDITDPEKSIIACFIYLEQLRMMFWGSGRTEKEVVRDMAVAYCWGPGNVKDHGWAAAPANVRGYAERIVTASGY